MIELICGDSMQLLPAIAEHTKGFDMMFLDPPFFEWAVEHGDKPDHNKLSKLAYQLLKPNGVVWLCGTQPQLIEDWRYWGRFFRVVFEIIQSKHSGTPPVNKWQPIRTHENIWCMIKDSAKISDTHLDIRSVTKKGKKVTKSDTAESDGMKIRYGKTWVEWRAEVGYPKSVWECSQIKEGSKEYVGHPTQKPLRLMELIVQISTKRGDWILDPYAGSGSTLVAAEELGRNCLAIEIKRSYCEIIMKRRTKEKQLTKLSRFM